MARKRLRSTLVDCLSRLRGRKGKRQGWGRLRRYFNLPSNRAIVAREELSLFPFLATFPLCLATAFPARRRLTSSFARRLSAFQAIVLPAAA